MRKPVNSENSPEHNCIINNRKITITFVTRTVHVRVAKLAVEWGAAGVLLRSLSHLYRPGRI